MKTEDGDKKLSVIGIGTPLSTWLTAAMTQDESATVTPGQRLRRLRELRDLSQERLAEKIGGISARTILRIEKGETELRPKRRRQFAAALGVPEAYFEGFIDLADLGLDDGDNSPATPDSARRGLAHLGYNPSEFFADVLLGMQRTYTEEGVPIGARELAAAAYDMHAEIISEASTPEDRDTEFAKQIRALRRYLRQHRIDILKSRQAGEEQPRDTGKVAGSSS